MCKINVLVATQEIRQRWSTLLSWYALRCKLEFGCSEQPNHMAKFCCAAAWAGPDPYRGAATPHRSSELLVAARLQTHIHTKV